MTVQSCFSCLGLKIVKITYSDVLSFLSARGPKIQKMESVNFINFCLMFESEITLFINEVWDRSAFDEELARNPHYMPHLDGEVMVPQDNSMLAFSTELLNYIIACHSRE